MDELREKITKELQRFRRLHDIDPTAYLAGINSDKNLEEATMRILALIKGAGYCKVPDLSLIVDEEFCEYEVKYCKEQGLHFPPKGEARDICMSEAQLAHTFKEIEKANREESC